MVARTIRLNPESRWLFVRLDEIPASIDTQPQEIQMSALLTPELLRRLEQFQLLAARRAKSSAKGERRSQARGQSVEFADYRNYVAGDDLRYLDWNLYGRLDRKSVV